MAVVGVWVLAGSWLLVGLFVVWVFGAEKMAWTVRSEILSRQWPQHTADPYLWQSIPYE